MSFDPNVPTPESLTQELQAYYKAMEEEFKLDPAEFDEEKRTQYANAAKAKLVGLIPTAVAALEYILIHSEKETVKLAAAKYVIDNTLGEHFATPVDPIEELVKRMHETTQAASE